MAGQVVAFQNPGTADERETLIEALVPLHTLITLDPILGAAPVRIYFVLNPRARRAILDSLDARDRAQARLTPAFALVAYDFPFALHLVETTAPQMPLERAKGIVERSASLQGGALKAAAGAFGIEAQPLPAFDADALKATFFPNTQETVTHLLRLTPGQAGDPLR
jgi:hypothetical protein